MTIEEFQRHIHDKYSARDKQRGGAATFVWFIEEVGELASALGGTDRVNLEEEFADVLAWLCTLANIKDIDLAAAVERKYLSGSGPTGFK
ncbi:MAG: nucleotide pyrophosphohydrolase [Phycisphaerae bacterium]|nr:nucleotide pyrophosphohydrolase [Phycisphaerae bacterium]